MEDVLRTWALWIWYRYFTPWNLGHSCSVYIVPSVSAIFVYIYINLYYTCVYTHMDIHIFLNIYLYMQKHTFFLYWSIYHWPLASPWGITIICVCMCMCVYVCICRISWLCNTIDALVAYLYPRFYMPRGLSFHRC